MIKNLFGLVKQSEKSNLVLDENQSNQEQVSQTTTSQEQVRQTATSIAPESVQKAKTQVMVSVDNKAKTLTEKYRNGFADNAPILFTDDPASLENVELVIRATYKQVFGNAHLMESERLREVESQMRYGQITVGDFVRQLAKSEVV